ncbi:MAG: LysR family transcriptional regulator [Verrucomicrobiaceae bacterium]|nr:LysR family transcriptional regulator [Verrucomicrobiaceae bacterium]MDB6119569.1 LysR family transcriptional regulator [Verrucomicrobiaceae bacterium]
MAREIDLLEPGSFVPMESHRLLVFHAVAQTGTIAEAARQMCLTRSALSHALRTFEVELGCALFRREDRKMALTSAGERLLPQARSILEAMHAARISVMG